MFVFREEVSSPQQGLLQLRPVVGPGRAGVAALTVCGVGLRLRPPGPGDGALVGGGLAGGRGRGDESAAASV